MISTPKIILRPQPLPPIRAASPSPSPRVGPAIVAVAMIFSIFATLMGLAASGIGLVEW